MDSKCKKPSNVKPTTLNFSSLFSLNILEPLFFLVKQIRVSIIGIFLSRWKLTVSSMCVTISSGWGQNENNPNQSYCISIPSKSRCFSFSFLFVCFVNVISSYRRYTTFLYLDPRNIPVLSKYMFVSLWENENKDKPHKIS